MKLTLSDAADDYMAWRGSMDYSKQTIRNEKSTLKRFLTAVGNIYIANVTDRHVTIFFTEAAKTRGPGALRGDHAALKSFFEWCRHTRKMAADNDPMRGRRKPKLVKKERNRLHVSSFDHLLNVAEAIDPRDRACCAVLLYTLMRDQEVADLRVGDVDLDGGWLGARITKSHIEDRMPISSELDAELRLWLTTYTKVVGRLHSHYYLIPRRRSAGIAEKDERGRIRALKLVYDPTTSMGPAGRLVRPVLEGIGFPVTDHAGNSLYEGAHTIRRSGARALFDRLCADGYDGSLRVVQSMLHHSSLEITERYIGISADRATRDKLIRGQRMYLPENAEVVRLVN